MRTILLKSVGVILCLAVIVFCSKNEERTYTDKKIKLSEYLPDKINPEGWKTENDPRLFEGDDLFIYINGGAEIYHEYNFERVIIQEYVNYDGNMINLEIFEMKDDRNAYGMYTFKTGAEGEEISVGDGGLIEGYYMNFRKGKFLVTLTGFDDSETTAAGLRTISKAVDIKIPGGGKTPELTAVLESDNLIRTSVRYLKGQLGLFNSYAFFTENVFKFQECVKGDYNNGYTVFVFKYEDEESCKIRFELLKGKFGSGAKYADFHVENPGFSVTDSDKRTIRTWQYKQFILISISPSKSNDITFNVDKILRNIDHLIR